MTRKIIKVVLWCLRLMSISLGWAIASIYLEGMLYWVAVVCVAGLAFDSLSQAYEFLGSWRVLIKLLGVSIVAWVAIAVALTPTISMVIRGMCCVVAFPTAYYVSLVLLHKVFEGEDYD